MSWKACTSCGGQYEDPQAGNERYFHACPPARDPATGIERDRANKRDENVATVRVDHDGPTFREVAVMRAAGAGVIEADTLDALIALLHPSPPIHSPGAII